MFGVTAYFHNRNNKLCSIFGFGSQFVFQLTVGTGSLQVRYDSENVIHQVGPLLVLQDAACGGVGRVHVGQVGQVHP